VQHTAEILDCECSTLENEEGEPAALEVAAVSCPG
jgi:hypothetical protein